MLQVLMACFLSLYITVDPYVTIHIRGEGVYGV